MKFTTYILICLSLICCYTIYSSQIGKISLPELCKKSNLIVAGQVINVTHKKNLDRITIRIDCFLKGKTPNRIYDLLLNSRNELKGFDSKLTKDDTGIFFLKYDSTANKIKKAYWGSIALFPNRIFYLSKKDLTPTESNKY